MPPESQRYLVHRNGRQDLAQIAFVIVVGEGQRNAGKGGKWRGMTGRNNFAPTSTPDS